ncbi:hypothetical protein HAX54_030170 [Datura stramonium]|uniref:RRM domain-containing protein n=1 Tax=Datura stramonium TaxID=4076 RepID=A0ABS8SAP8_DATST|nr:hypothetical protein [Datura stramonium]
MYVDLFSGFAWHFFHVDPNNDIDKLGSFWLGMQRCNSVPLLPGWVKLNIYDARNEGKLNAEKLIIESDNFMLVQYVNVYHVYEEANEAARDWALRDECPNNGPNAASERKIYIFEAFGPVELVQLPIDPETGHCKGFGFARFGQLEHAKAAQSLNDKLEIECCTILVSSVTEHVGAQDAEAKTADFDDDGGGLVSLLLNNYIGGPWMPSFPLSRKYEVLGMNLYLFSLFILKLLRKQQPNFIHSIECSVKGHASGKIGLYRCCFMVSPAFSLFCVALASGSASNEYANGWANSFSEYAPNASLWFHGSPIHWNSQQCLLLKNMFDPATEMHPEFDLDIEDDVKEECSTYGRVKHIHVDKHSPGYLYFRFDSVEAASRAQQDMHKRWFAGRSISAIFL